MKESVQITLTKVLSLQRRGSSVAFRWMQLLKEDETTDLFVVFYKQTYFPLLICFSVVSSAFLIPVVERPVLHSPELHPPPRPETTEPAHQRHWRAKTR